MTEDEALAIILERRGTMYDPAVVDTFERVCRDIGAAAVKPQLQKAHSADQQGGRMRCRDANRRGAVPVPVAEGPESLRALANLARMVSGGPSRPPMWRRCIWAHVRHVVPNASCGFFLNDLATDSVKVRVRGRRRRADAAGPADEARRTADRVGGRESAADRQFGSAARSRA